MFERRILHISDIHFDTDMYSLFHNEIYRKAFLDSLKEILNLDTIVISGDLVDKGGSKEGYDLLKTFFDEIHTELGSAVRILCVPGNHDVNRELLNATFKSKGNEELWKKDGYNIRFQLYNYFAEATGLNTFIGEGVVFCEVLNDPGVIILGLDSTFHIATEDNVGFINVENLENLITEKLINEENNYDDYVKIAVLHHYPCLYYNSSSNLETYNTDTKGVHGSFEKQNWDEVKAILTKYGFKFILSGHVHGSKSVFYKEYEQKEEGFVYSTVGSIGINFNNEVLEIFKSADFTEADENAERKKKELFDNIEGAKTLCSIFGSHNSYNVWTINDLGLVKEEQYKCIIDEGVFKWVLVNTNTHRSENEINDSIFSQENSSIPNEDKVEKPHNAILSFVRNNHLLRTGHYHWNKMPRLHWINTMFFIQDRKALSEVVNGFINVIRENNLDAIENCFIGLGFKGTILLSYLYSMIHNSRCTYMPENNGDYNEYELSWLNDLDFEKITIITDVVHTGNTIIRLIKKIYKDKFLSVNVLSIFDTTPDGSIPKESGKYRSEIHALAHITIRNCDGGGNNCPIYKEKLTNIYEYDEDSL